MEVFFLSVVVCLGDVNYYLSWIGEQLVVAAFEHPLGEAVHDGFRLKM